MHTESTNQIQVVGKVIASAFDETKVWALALFIWEKYRMSLDLNDN